MLVEVYYLEKNIENGSIKFFFETGFFQIQFMIYTFFCTVDWFWGSFIFGAPIYIAYYICYAKLLAQPASGFMGEDKNWNVYTFFYCFSV
jgi:hypothetical protein